MPYKPNCQGMGKGFSLDRTRYYAIYYQMYKHQYKQRYLENKNSTKDNINYKQRLIDSGFLIVK